MEVGATVPAAGREVSATGAITLPHSKARSAAGEALRHMTGNDISSLFTESIVIKMVPVSADQLSVLESLERSLLSLYVDFQRDVGAQAEDVAGGLHRLIAALGMLTSFWKEQAEDLATIDSWRAALNEIRTGELDSIEAQRLAAKVLR